MNCAWDLFQSYIFFPVHRAVFSPCITVHTTIFHTVSAHADRTTLCVVGNNGCVPRAVPGHSAGQSHRHDGVGKGLATGWAELGEWVLSRCKHWCYRGLEDEAVQSYS